MSDIKDMIEMKLKPYETMCDRATEHLREMITGGECYDTQEICEVAKTVGAIVDIKKDIVEMCYKEHILQAMEEESGADDERRYYKGSRGARYGGSSRMGYDDPMHRPEYWRDMDKDRRNVMYYTEPNSRYDKARRGYEEAKKMGDDHMKMDKLEKWLDEFAMEVENKLPEMGMDEKNIARDKMQELMHKLQ